MSGDDEAVPYHRYAFHNPYNYTLMAAATAMALVDQSWWLLVLGGGLEALWMLFAPDSLLLRHLWFDKVHAARKQAEAEAAWRRMLDQLPGDEGERVERLHAKRVEILRLVGENRAFTGELLRRELDKLDRLVAAFAELAL